MTRFTKWKRNSIGSKCQEAPGSGQEYTCHISSGSQSRIE